MTAKEPLKTALYHALLLLYESAGTQLSQSVLSKSRLLKLKGTSKLKNVEHPSSSAMAQEATCGEREQSRWQDLPIQRHAEIRRGNVIRAPSAPESLPGFLPRL